MIHLSTEQKRIAWQAGILHWKLHAAQRKIYKLVRNLPTHQREALILCARGFGKSFLGVIFALEDCLQNPGVEVAIIGPSLKQAKNIVGPIMKLITRDAPAGLITQKKSTTTWECSNGSTLIIGGFDTALEATRGKTLFNIYLEETGFSTAELEEYRYILYSVLMPCLRSRVTARLTHLTTPGRLIDHPLHLETIPRCELANALYIFTIEHNPLLTPEQIALEIESMGGMEAIAVQRELFCRIVRDDSITVIPHFNEARHVAKLSHKPWFVYTLAGDTGGIRDLDTFHLLAYDHDIGKVLVLAEKWFPNGTATSMIVESLKEWEKVPIGEELREIKSTKYVDAPGRTQIDLASLGFSAALPTKDKFDSTITFARNEFFNDRLLIDESCSLLIQTCRSGAFNKKRTDFVRNSVLGHCDALMDLVYGLRHVDRTTDNRPSLNRATHNLMNRNKPHNLTKLTHQG